MALALALLAPGAFAQREVCTATTPWGTYEYECPGGDPENDAQAPWWARNETQLALGIVGILGSAGAAGYTFYRVRSRRKALTSTLLAIETAYVKAKSDPEPGIARLVELRARVRSDHDKGKLDDAHFLDLDRRATDYLVKLRLLEIDRRFATLPPMLLAEIRRLLGDGVLTAGEADLIEVRAAAYRVPDHVRAELADLARRWAGDDAGRAEEMAAS